MTHPRRHLGLTGYSRLIGFLHSAEHGLQTLLDLSNVSRWPDAEQALDTVSHHRHQRLPPSSPAFGGCGTDSTGCQAWSCTVPQPESISRVVPWLHSREAVKCVSGKLINRRDSRVWDPAQAEGCRCSAGAVCAASEHLLTGICLAPGAARLAGRQVERVLR
jgi:hypothetical protein